MHARDLTFVLGFMVFLTGAAEARLSVVDKISTYRRAPPADRLDLATRLGKSFSALSPGLDKEYFLRCLEETANVGDPRDIEIEAAVKLCVAAEGADPSK
ncbi:hypothetical protein AOPFMNJM_2660 [Methylobacterium jeotgali]|uniref:Uncharacterized protein n=2 Tax=Methylobacteriaceae TaxID=119045 RepID=A0ABQ4SW44_9HYPH|nr:hypothetical protein AwMethylo_35220 [Methylobacterium sp.]GJE07332.1 hypothetical protein AOPFMNJM_2660 [Methylobacterium jeotgali]